MLAVDVETYPIQSGNLAPPLVCVSYARPGGEAGVMLAEAGADLVEAALDSGEIIITHNGPFDFAVLCVFRPRLLPKVFRGYERGQFRDTKIRQRLIDIANGANAKKHIVLRRSEWVKPEYSLAALAKFYLGKDRSHQKEGEDIWRLRFGELDGIPVEQWPAEPRDYAIEDAQDTLEVFLAQRTDDNSERAFTPDASTDDLAINELEQLRADWALHLMSIWGLRSDAKAVDELEARVKREWKALQEKMLAEGLFRLEQFSAEDKRKNREPDGTVEVAVRKKKEVRPAKYVKNTEAIQARVQAAYEAQGRKPPMTAGGEKRPPSVKCDADALEQSGDPLLMELGETGPIGTILRTFIPTLRLGTSVPINTRFQVLLETGRISSAAPNLNNLPREGGVRECLGPRPDRWLVSVDYDCAELRSHAQVNYWLFGYAKAHEFFNLEPSGDPHLELAASILGISSEEAKALKVAGDKTFKNARQASKPINFGYPGGLGAQKMADSARKSYGVIMSVDEARKYKDQWLTRWPEMRDYLAFITKTCGLGGARIEQLRPPVNGKHPPHRRRGDVGYTDGANGFFQGLTADGAKHALWLVAKECYTDESSPLFGSRPVGFLYDEIICEVPVEKAHEAAHRLRDVMVAGMREWLPDIPVTASPALMTVWRKGAEPVYVDGKLVPWEPKPAPPPAT